MSFNKTARQIYNKVYQWRKTNPQTGDVLNLDCGCIAKSIKPIGKGVYCHVEFDFCNFHFNEIEYDSSFYRDNNITKKGFNQNE